MDGFWAVIDEQLTQLKSARTAQEVVTILSPERNPYGHDNTAADGFFAGSGGDGTVRASLNEAGWNTIWSDASYYYAMQAPDGSAITYVEGDIYTRDLRAHEPTEAGCICGWVNPTVEGDEPCTYGHFNCAQTEGGACANELRWRRFNRHVEVD